MVSLLHRQPKKTLLTIMAVWGCIAVVNAVLIRLGITTGAPVWFPISIFTGPTVHAGGLLNLALFVALLVWAIGSSDRLTGRRIAVAGLGLIVLGNLGQGGGDAAFVRPFTDSGIQYYHDALNITSWRDWLATFTDNQAGFFDHTRTHPPFATLLHHLFLVVSGGNVLFLSGMFTVLSGVSVYLVWHILRILGVTAQNRNLLAILFAVLPAVNIYSAVTLDGVILTTATLFLLGVVLLVTSARFSLVGMALFILGMLLTNLLTFGGVFLIAVAGVISLGELVAKRRYPVTIAGAVTVAVTCVVIFSMNRLFGYNHITGFFAAADIENPAGFRGFSEPLVYLFTRIESLSEIALFFSLGCFAVVMHPERLGQSYTDWRRDDMRLMLTGVGVLCAMLLAGAFRTGETARCSLFIYPYLMLAFTRADPRVLKDLIILAGAQTAVMQLFGGYFW